MNLAHSNMHDDEDDHDPSRMAGRLNIDMNASSSAGSPSPVSPASSKGEEETDTETEDERSIRSLDDGGGGSENPKYSARPLSALSKEEKEEKRLNKVLSFLKTVTMFSHLDGELLFLEIKYIYVLHVNLTYIDSFFFLFFIDSFFLFLFF